MKIRRILHASDFSPASRPAFRLARELAQAFKAELVLFHAVDATMPIGTGEGFVSPAVFERVWRAARQRAEREMKRLRDRARKSGVRTVTALEEGPAALAIVKAAKRRRADLIVIGTHGRTGVQRFLLGSIAERVVRTSRVPVLTVPGA